MHNTALLSRMVLQVAISEYISPVTIASCALGSSSYPVGQERAHTPSACPVCPTLCVTAPWTHQQQLCEWQLEQQQTCQKKMSHPAEKKANHQPNPIQVKKSNWRRLPPPS